MRSVKLNTKSRKNDGEKFKQHESLENHSVNMFVEFLDRKVKYNRNGNAEIDQ